MRENVQFRFSPDIRPSNIFPRIDAWRSRM